MKQLKLNTDKHKILLALIFSFLILFISCQEPSTYKTTKELLEAMKAKNDSTWFQHFTFKQHTLFFDESGKQTDSTVWYETVSYPYLFRIDRDIQENVYTIYRNDSTYHFRQDSLVKATNEPAVHLLFKGGLYFVSLEESLAKLKKYNFNIDDFRKDTFMENPVYVIGDEDNQFWLHAQDFYCMRRIYTTNKSKKVDVVYDNFKPLGNGWVEQKVIFYFEGKKRMEEYYFDINLKNNIPSKVYNFEENYKWFLD